MWFVRHVHVIWPAIENLTPLHVAAFKGLCELFSLHI